MTTPPGNRLLVGVIKKALREKGWTLAVYDGPGSTTGTVGETIDLKTKATYQMRYRLMVEQDQIDYCLGSGPLVSYDLSLIDNSTGVEVFTQSGKDCEESALAKFMETLEAK